MALKIVLQAAQGLAAANARGLIHRDIKPANLMLVHLDASGLAAGASETVGDAVDSDGEDLLVKVIDFGLAKVVLDDKNGSSLSLTGEGPIGTPYYMSPEQIDSAIGEVDARSDIYSLGVTLWYLLTGQPPFVGTQFQVFRQHIGAPPPLAQLPVAVPDNVRDLLGRMMGKTPAARPANTRELIGQIRELLRGSLVPGVPDAPVAPAPIPVRVTPPPVPVNVTPPPVPIPSIPPSWPPPQSVQTGATLPEVGGQPLVFKNLSSTVPPGVYVPPPNVARGSEWKIFGGVLLAALLLGGIPLAYFILKGKETGGKGGGTPGLASATPLSTATPVPSAGYMWKSLPPPSASSPAAGARTLTVPSQYATVQAAIDAAKSGDTVKVGRGTFREKLTFKSGIRLVGDDMSTTTISVPGTGPCLYVLNCVSGTVSGITFEHTAANPKDDVEYIVWLRGSAVQLRDCRVRNSGSTGISCEDADKSLVENCEIVGAHAFGLRAMGAGTTPVFRGNHVQGSAWSGICFSDGAAGLAENNICEDGAGVGFTIQGSGTAPTINGNTARHNKLSGFSYEKGAGGHASGNTVADNTEAGFRVADVGTAPALSDNQAKGNGLSGFNVLDGAGGLIDSNTSDGNVGSGVLVIKSGSNPVVKNNRLTGNKGSGIYFRDGAVGTAESNTISGNTESGIFLDGKGTAPTLRGNQVRSNGYDGITVREGAAGLIDGNICEDNTLHGIGVYDAGTSPTLGSNQCENNVKGSIYVEKGAAPKKNGGADYEGFFK